MTAHSRQPVVAAVDIGSNSVKLTVGRSNGTGGVEILAGASETVRLGENVATSGVLAQDRIAVAMKTLRQFAGIARQHGAVRLVGVATEATRQASNGPDFLARVQDDIGWDLRVISGDEEAALTFRGLASDLNLEGSVVVADIGGGSTEVIMALDGQITSAESLRLGSGTLTDRLVNSNPPTADELSACIAAATDKLAGVTFPAPGTARMVTVGGTGEYMVRLVPDPSRIGPADLAAALERCRSIPASELAVVIGAQPARARVLPAGLAIIQALVNRIQPERIEIGQSGIRTGLLLAAFDDIEGEYASGTPKELA